MNDLISKQDAIDALNKKRIETMEKGQDVNLIWECLDVVAQVPSAQHWIPCSEGSPKKNGNYIVTLSYTEGFKFSFVDIDNFSVNERQWNVYGSDVIAWMPLPEPWRGEKDKNARI